MSGQEYLFSDSAKGCRVEKPLRARAASARAWAQPGSHDGDEAVLDALLKRQLTPDNHEPWLCLLLTIVFYGAGFALLMRKPCWLTAALHGCAGVRCFIVFHDACHMSFFRSRTCNEILAQFMGLFACTTPKDWRESHNHHHAHLGDSSFFDGSLTIYHDVAWFVGLPWYIRLPLRVWRDPFMFFWTMATFLFHLDWCYRLIRYPDLPRAARLVLYMTVFTFFGWELLCWFVTGQVIGGTIGVMLFHLQHQCNEPYRVEHQEHTVTDAGLLGSTCLSVPFPLTSVTLGIEFHHVHHASTRVPCYRLQSCHREGELLGLWKRAGVNFVGPTRALQSLCHVLYATRTSPSDPPRFVSFPLYRCFGLQDGRAAWA